MSPRRSSRFDALPGYPLAEIPAIRRRLRAEGVDVIDLGAGDADLMPPPAARARLAEAIEDPSISRYPFQVGLPALRESLATWMAKRFGVRLDAQEELLPLLGSKEGIAKLPFAFMEPGDAAIIPDPGYQAYRGPVILAGGEAHLVPLRPENDFLIPLGDLPSDLVKRTQILYLNYPNNPTAACAPDGYFREAIEFCTRHDILLVHDHAYSEIAFDGYRPRSILEFDGASDVALEFHSFSKTYNMTGWRLGWVAGNRDLLASLTKVKTFLDTGVFKGVQAAGVAALECYDEWVPENVAVFQGRRNAAVTGLRQAGFDVSVPKATMYLWVPVPGGEPSMDFTKRVLEETGTIVLPGAALGAGGEGFFRVALTVSEERLSEAARRLGRCLR
jgi:LL-diaminopimelate aminotransferase